MQMLWVWEETDARFSSSKTTPAALKSSITSTSYPGATSPPDISYAKAPSIATKYSSVILPTQPTYKERGNFKYKLTCT